MRADSKKLGHGGKVIVWSDDRTEFHGTILARPKLGKGGFAEISGKNTLKNTGYAHLGEGGRLLLDPGNLTILTLAAGVELGDNEVDDDWITNQLKLSSVILSASQSSGGETTEKIWFKGAGITWASDFDLVLEGKTVQFDASTALTHTAGTGNLEIKITDATGTVTLDSGGTIDFTGSTGKLRTYRDTAVVLGDLGFGLTGSEVNFKYVTDKATLITALVTNNAAVAVALKSDIALTGNWTSVGTSASKFLGKLTGFDHTTGGSFKISGLTVLNPAGVATDKGFFGYTNGAVIDNITFTDPSAVMTGGVDNVGILVGTADDTTIHKVKIDDTTGVKLVSGRHYIGGLVGKTGTGTVITHSSSNINVGDASVENQVGGLVGELAGAGSSISHSYTAAGSVMGITKVGGLVGSATTSSLITNSFSRMDVGGTGAMAPPVKIGGLVGSLNGSDISLSFATGDVSIATAAALGGLAGESISSSTITESFSQGTVTGNLKVGGLVGNNDASAITDSFSMSDVVAAASDAGGLVGDNNSGTITTSYANGDVNDTSGVMGSLGGLAGGNTGTVTDSHSMGWSENNSTPVAIAAQVGDNTGGTITMNGKTGALAHDVAALALASYHTTWDMNGASSNWSMVDTKSMPYLKNLQYKMIIKGSANALAMTAQGVFYGIPGACSTTNCDSIDYGRNYAVGSDTHVMVPMGWDGSAVVAHIDNGSDVANNRNAAYIPDMNTVSKNDGADVTLPSTNQVTVRVATSDKTTTGTPLLAATISALKNAGDLNADTSISWSNHATKGIVLNSGTSFATSSGTPMTLDDGIDTTAGNDAIIINSGTANLVQTGGLLNAGSGGISMTGGVIASLGDITTTGTLKSVAPGGILYAGVVNAATVEFNPIAASAIGSVSVPNGGAISFIKTSNAGEGGLFLKSTGILALQGNIVASNGGSNSNVTLGSADIDFGSVFVDTNNKFTSQYVVSANNLTLFSTISAGSDNNDRIGILEFSMPYYNIDPMMLAGSNISTLTLGQTPNAGGSVMQSKEQPENIYFGNHNVVFNGAYYYDRTKKVYVQSGYTLTINTAVPTSGNEPFVVDTTFSFSPPDGGTLDPLDPNAPPPPDGEAFVDPATGETFLLEGTKEVFFNPSTGETIIFDAVGDAAFLADGTALNPKAFKALEIATLAIGAANAAIGNTLEADPSKTDFHNSALGGQVPDAGALMIDFSGEFSGGAADGAKFGGDFGGEFGGNPPPFGDSNAAGGDQGGLSQGGEFRSAPESDFNAAGGDQGGADFRAPPEGGEFRSAPDAGASAGDSTGGQPTPPEGGVEEHKDEGNKSALDKGLDTLKNIFGGEKTKEGDSGANQSDQPPLGADSEPLLGADGEPPLGADGEPPLGADGEPPLGADGEAKPEVEATEAEGKAEETKGEAERADEEGDDEGTEAEPKEGKSVLEKLKDFNLFGSDKPATGTAGGETPPAGGDTQTPPPTGTAGGDTQTPPPTGTAGGDTQTPPPTGTAGGDTQTPPPTGTAAEGVRGQ